MENNNSITKIVIIVLAVVCIILAGVFAYTSLSSCTPDSGAGEAGDIADYGMEETPDQSGEVTSTADGTLITDEDDGTVEMDSIPNEAEGETPPADGEGEGEGEGN
ncbi:MAG: hypothetical protein IJP17_03060 [Clostridia bacterium]|nr:hypothetical protein [Clostridia bacterium]